MLRVRWLLLTALVALAAVSLLQEATAHPAPRNQKKATKPSTTAQPRAQSSTTQRPTQRQSRANQPLSAVTNRAGGRGANNPQVTNKPTGGGGVGRGGNNPQVTNKPTGGGGVGRGTNNPQVTNKPTGGGGQVKIQRRKRPLTAEQVLKKKQRRGGVLAARKNGQKPPADSKKKNRTTRNKRRRKWKKRTQKKGKENKINETEDGLFKSLFNRIKSETKDLVEDLKEQAKEQIKDTAKAIAVNLLHTLTTELTTTLCDCGETDCECCVDWGVLGKGCFKVEVYTDEPGVDLMVIDDMQNELASVSLADGGETGPDAEACFNLIPYITDACIVPVSFEKTDAGIDASFNVTIEGFNLNGNYRVKYNNTNTVILGTEFAPFSTEE